MSGTDISLIVLAVTAVICLDAWVFKARIICALIDCVVFVVMLPWFLLQAALAIVPALTGIYLLVHFVKWCWAS